MDKPVARSHLATRVVSLRARLIKSWFGLSLLGIAVAALGQRIAGLDPTSLYLDDLWVAVLVSRARVDHLLALEPPISVGFVLLQKAARFLGGNGAWPLQLCPLLCAVGQIPLVALVVQRLTGTRSTAVFAALLLATSVMLGVYSVRIKPFACDSLTTTLLLWLTVRFLARPGLPAWWVLAAASLAGLVFSFVSMIFGVLVVHASALQLARRRLHPVVFQLIVYDVAVLLIAIGLIFGRANPSIVQYWQAFYFPLGSVPDMLAFITTHVPRLWTGACPREAPWLALLVPVGAGWLWAVPRWRGLGLSVVLFYISLLSVSALHRYPVGGGRTDIFAYPIAVVVAACGLQALTRFGRPVPIVAVVAVAGFWLIQKPRYYEYKPVTHDREMVELVNRVAQEGDGLIVYPYANWAAGYYGRWSVELVAVEDSTNRFYCHLDRPRTLVLHETFNGREFHEDAGVLAGQLLPFLAEGHRRLLYLGTDLDPEPHDWIMQIFRDQGYVLRQVEQRPGACMVVLEAER